MAMMKITTTATSNLVVWVRISHSSKLRRQMGARFDASGARRLAIRLYYPTRHHDTTMDSPERPTARRLGGQRWTDHLGHVS